MTTSISQRVAQFGRPEISRPGAVVIGAIVVSAAGCTFEPAQIKNPILSPSNSFLREQTVTFDGLSDDGSIELWGSRRSLAGIRMRPLSETQEPDSIKLVNRIVTGVSRQVRVEWDSKCPNVVIYYKHPIFYRDKYVPWWVLMPRDGWACLNELLIYMGLAEYDPQMNLGMKPTIAAACAEARLNYARGAYQCAGTTDFDAVSRDPSLIYIWGWYNKPEPAFRTCIARGDRGQCGSEKWRAVFVSGSGGPVKHEASRTDSDE